MESRYNHTQHEQTIYKQWEKSGAFSPTPDPAAKPYTIIMPPPNANDPLHIGHAMFVTIEDILIRYHRMKGEATLWLPGTDHAGIETQFVFEKKLAKQDKSRFDFDRETLYKMIWDYVQENSGVAVQQLKRLGASADWSRFKFTLDENVVDVVIDTFIQLYDDGLVYRDLRLVNYCTRCGTAFSDLEVVSRKQKEPLYYVRYKFLNPPKRSNESGFITVATVRPETIFADEALAVRPEDKRYKKLIGSLVVNPLTGKEIPLIADEAADPEFGTGALKVTPGHDFTDERIGKRHGLKLWSVIGFDGKLQEDAGEFVGLTVMKAREAVVEELKRKGHLEKIDTNYEHSVGSCYRCGKTIEPLPMPQFYLKVKLLTEKALKALKDKKVRVLGAGHDKILKHWLENLNDWNVSRQIVWGIRMPVWYDFNAKENDEIFVTFFNSSGARIMGSFKTLRSMRINGKKITLREIAKGLQELKAPVGAQFVVSPTSPGDNYLQETDTFDTWFSSAQWPYATLMTTKKGDFERFYPTSLMETGYDILPFWVMRMLMMGLYRTNRAPFKTVYLHGLIRDGKGQKMSKSKGNVINPLDIIQKYGADALRMALVIRSTPGLDKAVGEHDIRAMRNLTNKIWNAARFITMNLEGKKQKLKVKNDDEEFYKKLIEVLRNATQQLNNLKVGLAAETVYQEFWHWFCDQCIEESKEGKISAQALVEGLMLFLKLLHPFVPFVTEAVWQELKRAGIELDSPLLMTAQWPIDSR